MIYFAFFKSLITTIKPIFFRFFSIIKYLVLVLLAILLYMLVGRVGAINLNTLSESIRFQHEFTGHIYGLEHIPYHENNLVVSDVVLGQALLPVGNLLRSNYYSNKGYKVVLGRSYSSNFISGLMVTKKGTFNHTIGYPYGVDKLQTFNIPADGFLGGLSNLFSSKKFKNVVAHNFGFTFYNENSNENYLEVTSHMCGKEYPGYIITYVSFPTSTNTGFVDSGLRVYDLKNNLLYVYKDVGNQHNGPNSGGCGVVNYFSENADVVWKIRIIYGYQKGAIFLYNPIVNYRFQYGSHSENFHNYRGFHLVEKIAEKKAPEQYQVEHEKEKDQYQSSPAYTMCQKDYQHYKTQAFGLQQCILSNTGSFDPYPAIKEDILNYYKGDFSTGSNIGISYYSYLLNGQSPFQFLDANTVIGFCKIRIEKENQFYLERVGGGTLRTIQYADILNKQLSSINTGSVFPNYISEDDYCSYNKKYIGTTNDGTYSGFLDKLTDKLVAFISSEDFQNNLPDFLSPVKKYFDNYFNIENKDIVPGLVNYCKEGNGYTVANILYIMILLSILFIIYKFTL